jgi:hypothetical protein
VVPPVAGKSGQGDLKGDMVEGINRCATGSCFRQSLSASVHWASCALGMLRERADSLSQQAAMRAPRSIAGALMLAGWLVGYKQPTQCMSWSCVLCCPLPPLCMCSCRNVGASIGSVGDTEGGKKGTGGVDFSNAAGMGGV